MLGMQRAVGIRLNGRQKLVVVGMDLLLLAQLTFCIYWGHQDPENMAGAFLRSFLPMAVGTLVAARLLIRRLGAAKGGVKDRREIEQN